MNARQALAFVKKHGVVLMSGRGAAPSLAEAVAGEPIRGSWWSHARGKEIFRACGVVSNHADVLTCRLIDGKVTFVHRRLWPSIVRLARKLPRECLASIREEHTSLGKHRVTETPFPGWVPGDVADAAAELTLAEASAEIGEGLVAHLSGRKPTRMQDGRR